jgi:pyridoxamine 5'-phosphate oxidase
MHFLYWRMNIADLRKSYERDELDESASAADPMAQFGRWLEQALQAELPEPNAMTLATVGADGRPSTRVVLIKGYDAQGIVWYTNYESRKAQDLAHQPCAALQFHWVELERTVRIEGRVKRPAPRNPTPTTPRARSIRAWAPGLRRKARSSIRAPCWWPARPRRRRALRCIRHARRTGAATAWCPISWEFWQGRKSRLHDRLRYRLDGRRLDQGASGALSRQRAGAPRRCARAAARRSMPARKRSNWIGLVQ